MWFRLAKPLARTAVGEQGPTDPIKATSAPSFRHQEPTRPARCLIQPTLDEHLEFHIIEFNVAEAQIKAGCLLRKDLPQEQRPAAGRKITSYQATPLEQKTHK
jgi:hypothetical protein